MSPPLISALVSTYNAERFMRGCLEDLERQTIASELEIIVVDSCSPQNEGEIVNEYARRFGNIRYLRTDQREGLYKAWNRAIGMATGKYLTSANTDDRRRSDSLEKLTAMLESSSDVVLAYGDMITSTIENETFERCLARNTRHYKLPDFSRDTMILGCPVGSQPVWRRSVHEEHGLFSDKYRIAGDYEFWMRISQNHSFFHVREALGVFFDSPNTLSGSDSRYGMDMETLDIQLMYLARDPWRTDRHIHRALAQRVFATGYHYVEHSRDLANARRFLWEAWKLDPFNFNLAKTWLVRGLLGSRTRLR